MNQQGIVTIGVAAHICAASMGGPRYDLAQSKEERRGKENGIWLCQNCGRLIDADPLQFSKERLHEWKRTAQERALRDLLGGVLPHSTPIDAENSTTAGAIGQRFARLQDAARSDIRGYSGDHILSGSLVELTLTLWDRQEKLSFNISKLPSALEIEREVAIIAPPGTGKTTTLLQLADYALAENELVPLYFALGDWSASSLKLLDSLRGRLSYKDVLEDDIRFVAQQGKLLLLLDGWNELEPTVRKTLRAELKEIRGHYPSIFVVVATRQHALDVPISGVRVVVEQLSADQQMEIARARSGIAGEKIVDEAWRTPGVRELIAIPLYLAALLSAGSQISAVSNKESVLRLFVQEHENANQHAEALHAMLFGCHSDVLRSFASYLNSSRASAATNHDARRIIGRALERLRSDKQLVGPIEPGAVLDLLVSHHVLMRHGGSDGSVAFQHQQFQEWYASHDVVDLIRASAKNDVGARKKLRGEILDQPAWEESVLFAIDRLSIDRKDAHAVAHAVRVALPIDPMLAGEMIYRASSDVWNIVSPDILAFVDRWHVPGTVDRAVRFMIVTGRSEFATLIWPLATSSDPQIQLPTLRSAPRFRPTVLGGGIAARVAHLSETVREHLLSLIASESGVDGLDLATALAAEDPSPQVQADVLQHLDFRGADRHVAMLLGKANEEVWDLVARRSFVTQVRDPLLAAMLERARQRVLEATTSPVARLDHFVEHPDTSLTRDVEIANAIADPDFPVRDHVRSFYEAQQIAPAAVLNGLRRRLEDGLDLPVGSDDLLVGAELVDGGPLVDAVMSDDEVPNEGAIAHLVGSKTIGFLIEKYNDCLGALDATTESKQMRDLCNRLHSRLLRTDASAFISAVISHELARDSASSISMLSSLISLHGGGGSNRPLIPVSAAVQSQVISLLSDWTRKIIESPEATRGDLCNVANAIGRFGFPELLPQLQRLLDEDLARLKTAKAGYRSARQRGDIRAASDASMRYGNQYRVAFANLGTDEAARIVATYLEDLDFGFDASLVLKSINDSRQNRPLKGQFARWPWLEDIAEARKSRAIRPAQPAEDKLAETIFDAIENLIAQEVDPDAHSLAIQLTRIALSMPHGNHDDLVARVASLPKEISTKCELLAAMALDGQVLDASLLLEGIAAWREKAGRDAWQSRQNTWAIEPWLELLPFSERPELIIPALVDVRAFYGTYRHRFERVLFSVREVPGQKGDELLRELARSHPDIANGYDWMKTMFARGPSGVTLFLDLFADGALEASVGDLSRWNIAREFSEVSKKFPVVKAEIRRRYMGAQGLERKVYEQIFAEIGESGDLMAIVRSYAELGKPFDDTLRRVVHSVALRHQPIDGSSTHFEIYPSSVAGVRAFLFGIASNLGVGSDLAKHCLVELDELRDEHGFADEDPRHPDIASDLPWPPEARLYFLTGEPIN
ncbi:MULTISPECIES: NACHT domain-containing protein [Agrobacterium]|uniref:NACHT domain-containing protein n=1 Tax=Agrobacterium TaxID=357 RepID=UPI0027BA3501|nr:hypothetical protein [Agrobacterium sp. SORGH_AS_0745]